MTSGSRQSCAEFAVSKEWLRQKKAPADYAMVLAMCANVGVGLASLRDRALLLLGFSIAARRSELVALDVADIVKNEHGLMVRIRRSKTDQ